MKVLFLKDNLPTAMAGEIKEVKPGFARNFLIPQGIAELANKSSTADSCGFTSSISSVLLSYVFW